MFTFHVVNKRFDMFRTFEQNKNVVYIPFIKHWGSIFFGHSFNPLVS